MRSVCILFLLLLAGWHSLAQQPMPDSNFVAQFSKGTIAFNKHKEIPDSKESEFYLVRFKKQIGTHERSSFNIVRELNDWHAIVKSSMSEMANAMNDIAFFTFANDSWKLPPNVQRISDTSGNTGLKILSKISDCTRWIVVTFSNADFVELIHAIDAKVIQAD